MPSVEELNNSLNKVAANLRQNRFKLEQLLITIQVQQQTVMDSLQKIMEEQITLQGIVSGSLSRLKKKRGPARASRGFSRQHC